MAASLRLVQDSHAHKLRWRQPTHWWVTAVAKTADDRVAVYATENITTGRRLDDFTCAEPSTRWEGASLFELPIEAGAPGETAWVLVVGGLSQGAPAGGVGARLFVGDFDGEYFTVEQDRGSPPTGWTDKWARASQPPAEAAHDALEIPRTLSLRRTTCGLRLVQTPNVELEKLRGVHHRHACIQVGSKGQDAALFGLIGDRLEVEVEIDLSAAAAGAFLISDEGGIFATVGVDGPSSTVFLERAGGDRKSRGGASCQQAPITFRNSQTRLRIFFDHSIIEVFAEEGERVLTAHVERQSVNATWTLAAAGGVAAFRTLSAWRIAEP